MFTLEVKKLSKVVAFVLLAASTTYAGDVKAPAFKDKAIDGGVVYKVKDGSYAGVYRVNTQVDKATVKFGRTPSAKEIKAGDIDVRYDWQGLPDGKGSVERGDELFEAQCAMCHGDMGTGGRGYPPLAGGDIDSLKNQLIHPENGDEPPMRAIGSYWPYASTLWWYVKTAMPFPHPMSLSDDDVYAIVAYLLSVNEVQIDGKDLDDDFVLDKKALMKVVMPNVNGFYPEVNGKDGAMNMKKFLSDSSNYGTPTKRCMKNCPTGKVVRVKNSLDSGIEPAVSQKRDLPKVEAKSGAANSKYADMFEQKCNACHGNKVIAPVPGDKEAWASRIKQGKEVLYEHAIKGFQGMPPKGGHADLSDAELKGLVDYMVDKSK
jgi:cytochrome c